MDEAKDTLSNPEKSQMVKQVEFVGLDKLEIDDFVTATIKSTAQKSFEKIKGMVKQDASLKVHIKRHFAAQESKRHKYSIVLHLEYPGKNISIDNVSDWDLTEGVKIAMKELEKRISHIFKTKGVGARNAAKSRNE